MRPRSSSSASRGSARRACWPSSPRARTPRGGSSSRAPRRSSSATCPFSVFVDALDEYLQGLEPGRAGRARRGRADGARARLPVAVGARDRARRWRSSTSATAATARCARCSSASRTTRPLVLVLDDLHWADSASVELLGALLRRPPAAPVLVALAFRPRQVPERLVGRARAGGSRGDADAHRARRAHARRGARAAGRRGRRRRRDRALRGERRQSLLPRAARAVARPRSGAAAVASDDLAGGDRRPVGRRRCAQRGARAAVRRAHASCWKERRWRAIRSSPSWRRPRRRRPRRRRWTRSTSSCSSISFAPPTCPRRFRFRHPLVRRAVYEATRGRLAARRARALRRGARGAGRHGGGARAPRRALGARGRRRAPWPSCARPARKPPGSRRRAPRAGSERRCASCRRPRRRRSASSSSLAALGRADGGRPLRRQPRRAAGGARDRARRRRTRCAPGSPAPAPRSRACSDGTSRPARRLAKRPRGPARPGLARGGGAHDRARREPRLAREVRGDARVGRARGGRGEAARRRAADRGGPRRARARGFDDGRGRASRGRSCGGGGARRFAVGRRARPPPRGARPGSPASELYLDRYAEGDAHADARTGRGARDRPGRALPRPGRRPSAGSGACAASWPRPASCSTAASRRRACWATRTRSSGPSAAARPRRSTCGDVELALATAQEAVDLSAGLDEGFHSAEAAADLAAHCSRRGSRSARSSCSSSPPAARSSCSSPAARGRATSSCSTRCWLALDRHAEARRAAAAARGLGLGACSSRWLAPGPIERRRRSTCTRGDAARAAERALASAAAADEAGAPVEAALSRTLAGRALAEAGERDRAAAELQRAAAAFEALRRAALPRRGGTRAAEARPPHPPAHAPRQAGRRRGLESLTERELQVARLVVDRKTNPQIAAELFLSQKTVETHLRNIFRKVGVSSRVELARAVERADRAAGPTRALAHMRKARAAIGSFVFLLLAPVVAGLVPWLLTGWEARGKCVWLPCGSEA